MYLSKMIALLHNDTTLCRNSLPGTFDRRTTALQKSEYSKKHGVHKMVTWTTKCWLCMQSKSIVNSELLTLKCHPQSSKIKLADIQICSV